MEKVMVKLNFNVKVSFRRILGKIILSLSRKSLEQACNKSCLTLNAILLSISGIKKEE